MSKRPTGTPSGPSGAAGASNPGARPSQPTGATKNQQVLDQIKLLTHAIHSAKQQTSQIPVHRPPSNPPFRGGRGGRGRGRGTVPTTARYQPYANRPPLPPMASRRPPPTLSKNQTLVIKNSATSGDTKMEERGTTALEEKSESYVSRGNTLTRVGARKFPSYSELPNIKLTQSIYSCTISVIIASTNSEETS